MRYAQLVLTLLEPTSPTEAALAAADDAPIDYQIAAGTDRITVYHTSNRATN